MTQTYNDLAAKAIRDLPRGIDTLPPAENRYPGLGDCPKCGNTNLHEVFDRGAFCGRCSLLPDHPLTKKIQARLQAPRPAPPAPPVTVITEPSVAARLQETVTATQ